ncbi:MAG: hypothetical protein K4H23_05370 [Mollicutes bacterium PWAP]|nr:hypothetical protein [Mollicutes bacterium PWAP]
MKKGLKIGIGVSVGLILAGGIASSVAIPLVNRDKNDKSAQDVLSDDPLFGLIDNALNKDQNSYKLDQAVSQGSNFAIKILYDQEQSGSIELQKQWFDWDIFSLNKSLSLEKGKNHKDQKAIDNLNDKIKEKTDLKENLNHLDKIFINDTFDINKYPKLLLPFENVINSHKNFLLETKNSWNQANHNLYENAAKQNAAWIEFLNKNYGSSVEDTIALNEALKQVKDKAFVRYNTWSRNSEYTVEMMNQNTIFPWLKKVAYCNSVIDNKIKTSVSLTDKELSTKVWFYGTDSKITDLISVPKTINNNNNFSDTLDKIIKDSKIIEIKDELISIKRGEKYSDNWSVDKQIYENLLKNINIDSKKEQVINLLNESIISNTSDLEREIFLKIASSNSEDSKLNDGSLGVETSLHAAVTGKENGDAHEDGFKLGLLLALNKNNIYNTNNSEKILKSMFGTVDLVKLQNKISNIYMDIYKSANGILDPTWISQPEKYLKEITDVIFNDEALLKKLNIEIKNYMNGDLNESYNAGSAKDGIMPIYKIVGSANSYMTISSNGLHFFSIDEFVPTSNNNVFLEELQKIAENPEEINKYTNIAPFLNSHYTEATIMQSLVGTIGINDTNEQGLFQDKMRIEVDKYNTKNSNSTIDFNKMLELIKKGDLSEYSKQVSQIGSSNNPMKFFNEHYSNGVEKIYSSLALGSGLNIQNIQDIDKELQKLMEGLI